MSTWVTCENVYEETWRRLLEYANEDLAIELLTKWSGEPTAKQLRNYKKQARQIRVSILQSKEYFDVSRGSSLFTQPNHLYYGAVALASACILVRSDGSKSLDQLRKDPKNSRHGLLFTTSISATAALKGCNLLEQSHVSIEEHGHFRNWYNCLQRDPPVQGLIKRSQPTGRISTLHDSVGAMHIPKFSEIVSEKITIDELSKRLPDLMNDFLRFGITPPMVRGAHCVTVGLNKEISNTFTLHFSPDRKVFKDVVNQFGCEEGVFFCIDQFPNETSGVIMCREDKEWKFSFPDSRDTLDHKTIYFTTGVNTPEAADLYVASFALSMLSRYYPDIWVSFLESRCKGAKIVENIVRIMTLKYPMLLLNEISGVHHVISNHRPTWH